MAIGVADFSTATTEEKSMKYYLQNAESINLSLKDKNESDALVRELIPPYRKIAKTKGNVGNIKMLFCKQTLRVYLHHHSPKGLVKELFR